MGQGISRGHTRTNTQHFDLKQTDLQTGSLQGGGGEGVTFARRVRGWGLGETGGSEGSVWGSV